MKTMQIEVPDNLARAIENLVRDGWFLSEEELARHALSEFVHHNNLQLQEHFQREDIRWALGLKESKA